VVRCDAEPSGCVGCVQLAGCARHEVADHLEERVPARFSVLAFQVREHPATVQFADRFPHLRARNVSRSFSMGCGI
jgi:hypothetical protein